MKKRLLTVIALGLLLLAVGTGFYRLRPKGIYSATAQTESGKKPTEVWHVQDIPVWTLVRGQELVYDLSYSGNGEFPGQKDKAFVFNLQGTLSIILLAEESDAYRVWLTIKTDGMPQLNQVPRPMRMSLQKTWAEGVAARMAMRGFHLEPLVQSMDPTAAQFWETLADRIQVDLPNVLQTPVWSQQETMGGGPVVARYEIDPTLLTPSMLGEKIYVQKSYDADPVPQRKLSGESLILMQPRFEGLNQLEAQAREVQELNGQNWVTDSTVKLHWQKQNQVDESQVSSLESRWGKTRSARASSSQEESIQKAALGSMGLDDLWSQMNQPGSQNSQELYLKLKAWIYLNPDEIQRLFDRIKTLDEGDPALKMAIRALAAAGQPEAQDALVDLLDHRKTDVPLARKIITTLGFVQEPTLKAQQSLQLLSQGPEDNPVRRSSRLALGIMGQKLSQSPDPDSQQRARDIESLALQNLHRAKGLAAITDALAALGNCGLTRIEDLDPWLKHPDPAIRAQAFFALRFSKPMTTTEYLVGHYPKEASADVRKHILQAISLRTPDGSWFQAVQVLLTYSLPDEDKIILAKTLIGTVRKYRNESLKILAQLLDNTEDAAVRASLAKYQETAKSQVAL